MLAPLLLVALAADDLSTLRAAYREAETPAARVQLLDRVAALHTDANSVEVTELLAASLQDDDLAVRTHGAGLLAKDVDREVALTALCKGMRDLAREEATWSSSSPIRRSPSRSARGTPRRTSSPTWTSR